MSETTPRDSEEVLLINEKFYLAINEGDIGLMSGVWLAGPESKCVHPGWPMLYGWEAVRESWKNIFESGGPEGIELSHIGAQVSGDMAWVVCVEKISHRTGDGVRAGFAQSTNVFRKTVSGWKLVIHHASPIPMPRTETASDTNLQ